MKTNKIITLSLFVLGLSFLSFNQEKKHHKEEASDRVKNLKIGYFTKELNLTSSESEKFWPVYNEMDEKLKSIRKECKKQIDLMNINSDTMKDDEFKRSMNQIFDSEIQEASVKKEYMSKIASVIGYKKTSRLMKLEKEFKTMLLKEMRGKEKRGHHPPVPPPPHQE